MFIIPHLKKTFYYIYGHKNLWTWFSCLKFYINSCTLYISFCSFLLFAQHFMCVRVCMCVCVCVWNCCSVPKSCPVFCNPVDCSTPGSSVLHHLPEFAQTHVHWVSDAIQPSHPLCPLLLLTSIFPSLRVFSYESALCIMWPKYWSFSVSPSNEHSEFISFRIDWFDLVAVQGTLKNLCMLSCSTTDM